MYGQCTVARPAVWPHRVSRWETSDHPPVYRVHDKLIATITPYPLPAGSRLLQDLGFLAFTLPQVEILMPTKTPRAQERTLEQHRANQALHQCCADRACQQ